MKLFIYSLFLFGIVESSYANDFSYNMLQMCNVLNPQLSTINQDCSGMCGSNLAIYTPYKSKIIHNFFSELETKGIKSTCKHISRKRKALYCRCALISKKRYKSIIINSCQKDSKHIYLTNNFKQQAIETERTSLTATFMDQFNIYKILTSCLNLQPPKCLNKLSSTIPLADQNLFLSQLKQLSTYQNKQLSFPSLFSSTLPSNKTCNISPKNYTYVLDHLQKFNPCVAVNALISNLKTTPHFLSSSQQKIIRCLEYDPDKKTSRSITKAVKLIRYPTTSLSEAFQYVHISPNTPVHLYSPDGSEIQGKNLTIKLQRHRKIWITNTLEKLTPLINKLQEQYDDIQQRLMVETDPIEREKLEAELQELNQAKDDVHKIVAEIKDFKEPDNKLNQLKNKVTQAEKKLQRLRTPYHRQISNVRNLRISRRSPLPQRYSTDVPPQAISIPVNDDRIRTGQPDVDISAQKKATKNHKTKQVFSQKVTKAPPELIRYPAALNKNNSINNPSSTRNNRSNNSIAINNNFSSRISPQLMFIDTPKEDIKVQTVLHRLSPGVIYGIIEPKKKTIKLFKKDISKSIFLTEKPLAELEDMGILISSQDIKKLTKSTNKIFFEYNNGKFKTRSLKNIQGVTELNSIF